MSIATKSKYLATGVLAATLAFSPLFSGLSSQTIAFAEGDDDAQVEAVEATDNNENADGDVATQADGDEESDTPVVYGSESLSDWEYIENASDNSVTLTGYKGPTVTNFIIPADFGDGRQIKINTFNVLKDKGMTSLKVEEKDGKKVLPIGNSLGSAFKDNETVKSIDLSGLDTSKVTAMNSMFYGCSSLTDLDVSNFDTSKVTDMSSMFTDCSSLTDLDVSNFDTSNVTKMTSMFYGCSSLTDLDLSKFCTSNVTDMTEMFSICSSLTDLDVSNFDTSNTINFSRMFNSCKSLTNIDVSRFDTSKVTAMNSMFSGCSSLTDLDVSNFDTSNTTNFGWMFYNCSSLTNIDVSDFDTSKVTSMNSMFSGCSSLTDLDVSDFDTSKVTAMQSMFSGCRSLTDLDLSNFDTSNVTDMGSMFKKTNLQYLDLSSFTVKDNAAMDSVFDLATDDDGNVTELPTAIITTDPKLKALEQDGNLGNGRIPYQSTITFDSRDSAVSDAQSENNGIATYSDEDQTVKTIKSDKIFYDTVDEFEEAMKAFTLTKEQVLADIDEPTKAGYEFQGWFTDEVATTPLGESVSLQGIGDNLTLYAGWSKNEEPIVDPTPGENDNPGTGITDGDNNEQVGFDDSANANETDESVVTSAPKTGDMTYLVVFSVLGVALLATGMFVFARKRR